MRFGNSFGISSNFGKMYRENRYPKHEYFGLFSVSVLVSEIGQFRLVSVSTEITENVPKYSVYFLTTFWSGTTV